MKKRLFNKQRPVRIAIIGTGGMANCHAKSYSEIPGCRLVAGCDVDLPSVIFWMRFLYCVLPAIGLALTMGCLYRAKVYLQAEESKLGRAHQTKALSS
jgi:hypothetical protein